MTVIIRSLRCEDWRTYREVRLAALRDAPEAFGGSYDATAALPQEQWRDWCLQPSWFAFDGAQPVGMVRVSRHRNKALPELVSMWVAPEYRGSDTAARLVQAVLDWAGAEGDAGVYLRVMVGNARATGLYQRLGFIANGVADELPDGRGEIELEHRF